ncbi:protein kinase domain-containing protein [Nevskia soli]|uniref:protein kinase domain-containing protein n=1 Tax=Nevskia soli TaxID=418856 RepID=UPI000A069DD5|nr:winged helix-turn-helix domain-containing protein [Nevskia soli]
MTEKENLKPAEAGIALWKFAGAEFDEQKWELRVAGAAIELEPRPLEILLCLLRHAGETVTKEELLQSVWGHAYLSENALSNAIGKLRKALRDDAQSIIVTTYKVGYRLAVPVLRREPPSRPQARLGLKPGDAVPGRPAWLLERELSVTPGSEVWLAAPAPGTDGAVSEGARRVFKFSPDGLRLSSLKREAALSRLLQSTLGEREDLVRVLDWGFDRPPFFIECEYGGLSLPEWAEARGGITGLPLALRLELVAQVAEAVAMAHSVGVLHKDLKPANVLIYEDAEGAPKVRLTDFGSGTLTDPARLAEWGFTRMGTVNTVQSVSGTPLYMAPELLLGHSPTVQSDLYALGVMLYQLAVGDLRRPLAAGWEREIVDELLRQDIADAASGTPEHRLTSAHELAERLRHLGDRRRQHRLAREQEAAAVAARAVLERARMRRPLLIAAGAALSIGLLTSLFFFRQTLLSRNEERGEAEMVRAVNGFLDNDLLAAANPNVGGSMEVSVRDAIAKASGRIDARFARSPAMAVALHQTVGGAYRTLGQYADAEREFRSARVTAYSAFGAGADISMTSDLMLAQDLAYQNKYDEALALLAPIDSLVWSKPYTDQMIRVRLWDVHTLLDGHHSNLLAAAADAEQTQTALNDMRKLHARTYKSNLDYFYLAELHVGTAFEQAGQSRQAEEIERELVTQLTSERGAGDPLTIQAREKWLTSLISLGRIDEAAGYLPALDRDMRALGGHESPLQLEFVRVQARLASAQQRWADAIHDRNAVESGYARLFGVDNDSSIVAMMDTAATLRAAGQAEAAVGKYLEAYGLAEARQGPSGLLTQKIAYGLAAACLDAHKPEQSQLYLAHLNPAALAAAAPGRDWTAHLDYQRGRLAQQDGRGDEAKRDFAAALKLAQRGNDTAFAAELERALDEAPPAAGVRKG